MADGLRERKKAATREALCRAALRLTVERGYENVLVDDIATAAGVSPRTFNNYFTSKAEAVAHRHRHHLEQLARKLHEQPADVPLWVAIATVATTYFGGDEHLPDPSWAEDIGVVAAHPAVYAEFLKASVLAEESIAEVIGERTGADPFYQRLAAAAVGTAIRVAIEEWRHPDPRPLGRLIGSAIEQLTAGLPTP
ncbi:TetR/AcrR family transcriptional regulator [Pseudonocardia sp. TRM90224]|uniref:TetR/AcrR family transcriptional regulator n=1 Tax=Pseudonocardia sp. TRM90224 TaxID=2812678 RepID=UPI001E32EED8|nr:TetR/AcrR family transcriptional regulator [Pseudonocardia sp. TRM90224]